MTALSRLLPYRVRTAIEQAWHPVLFRRAMRRFLQAPQACEDPANPLLRQLIQGWGNADWSADPNYLAACIRHAGRGRGAILECGSGLSTLLAGHLATLEGRPYIALEHNTEWASRVRGALETYGVKAVEVRHAPLVDYGDYLWYAMDGELPPTIQLVLCDGPPGSGKGGRTGLLPCVGDRFTAGTVLLVDDYGRDAEAEMVRQWQASLPASVTVLGGDKPFAEMVVSAPPASA
jgi:hypothetical protein